MFEYTFTNGEGSIDTSFCKNFSDIKQELISQTQDCIHRRSTYPNGFVLEYLQYADRMVIRTNRQLIDCGNNCFKVAES